MGAFKNESIKKEQDTVKNAVKNSVKDRLENMKHPYIPAFILNERNIIIENNCFIKNYLDKNGKPEEKNIGEVIYPVSSYIDREELFIVFEFKQYGEKKQCAVSNKILNSNRIYEVLGGFGYQLSFSNGELKNYNKDLLMSLIAHLIKTKRPIELHEQLGWTDDDNFVIGNKIIHPDNIENFLIPQDKKIIFEKYLEKGNKEIWENCYKEFFSEQELIKQQVALLTGIATPLLQLNNLSGCVQLLYSKKSGNMKSTTQLFISGFYGEPEYTGDFTPNSFFDHAGVIKNLPSVYDEVGTKLENKKQIESFIDTIYKFTQGKTKSRSTVMSNGRVGLDKNYDFCSGVSMSANSDIRGFIENNTQGVAKSVRNWTLEINNNVSSKTNDRVINSFRNLKSNYGFGFDILQVIVKNKETITKRMEEEFNNYQKMFNQSNTRFIANTFASIIVMAEILNFHEFNININAIKEVLKQEVKIILASIGDKEINALQIIEEFLLDKQEEIELVSITGTKTTLLDKFIKKNVKARFVKNKKTLAIQQTYFNKFLKERYSIPGIRSIEDELKESHIFYEIKNTKINGVTVSSVVFDLCNIPSFFDDEDKTDYDRIFD